MLDEIKLGSLVTWGPNDPEIEGEAYEYGVVFERDEAHISYSEYEYQDGSLTIIREIAALNDSGKPMLRFIRQLTIEELLTFNDDRVRKVGAILLKEQTCTN